MKTVLETIQSGTEYLAKKGVESPRLNMQLLLAHALSCKKMELYLQFDRPLGEAELQPLREMLRRRGLREPLQHILGEVEFLDHTFRCDARALIPRPETEELVDFLIKHPPEFQVGDRVADVGTGSGVIGLSLAAAWREGPEFDLIDTSAEALALAEENRDRLGLPKEKVHLRRADLLPKSLAYRLIAANLPYIPTGEIPGLSPEVRRDPLAALDGGKDGLDAIERLMPLAKSALLPGGMLALEIGSGQVGRVMEGLAGHGFTSLETRRDMSGIERFVFARQP